MRISFDLDDTLICRQRGVPQEPRLAWYWRVLSSNEPLRRGTSSLMRGLQQRGWEIWIYTTSYRSTACVKRCFLFYGVRIARVINQQVHQMVVSRALGTPTPSKNPAAFGIDLHVDDSRGVHMEGEQHGFQVVLVSPDDITWIEVVMRAAEVMQGSLARVRQHE